ncbi:electron transfer flavoprotein subunit alpha/FixB family protein [Tepidibacillus fermentans]|uniref:Electron transfer flavoprotein alpha subunit apoprotein n=1 Tax=Tepidibacillus fermentans TaxID=1281767 RepID=A0A4R3KJB3_9BACI|nr:electron transfer flavoprotein subunit alpha/FixB family protein [Tepidibacillus fermentans]TCS83766.1 electron transfer flavoprotein alpha subunit apoprotein [Tepidibacillus fermentans]
MGQKVLVFAEEKNGKLRNVSFEVLAAAKKIANGGEIASILFGLDSNEYVQALAKHGADKVFVVLDPSLTQYVTDVYKEAFIEVVKQFQPDAILIGHTPIGRDMAPKIAAALKIGLITDNIDLEVIDDKIVFTRPIYAGKAFVKKIAYDSPVFATIRPNNIAMEEADPSRSAEKITLSFSPSQDALRVKVRDVIRKASKGVDLSEAKIVISGGRGVKSKEGFEKLYEVAEILGAAVGASRGACDAEYADYSLQVGQTGKVVTPDLYIALGISGAIQHVAGMSNSKVIVAVNKDPEAPIFQIADYGIVGDLFEVLPILVDELKALVN